MNVSSWLKRTKKFVSTIDAELMMLTVLGKLDRSDLVLCAERELSAEELDMLGKMLELRLRGVPMAYLMGRKEFYGRDFKVNSSVLIPRPETEQIIEFVKKLDATDKTIIDVGTGSGCIAVTLALETDAEKIVGLDISEDALEIAKENAERLGAKVEFEQSDLLSNCPLKGDIVVANLPYVDRAWEWTSPEIEYEPAEALFAGEGGLELIYKLIDTCEAEYLILESDPSQQKKIIDYCADKYCVFEKSDYAVMLMKVNKK